MAGLFITFEGGEAAGKTTQITLLQEHLAGQGYDVVRTREPGGAPGAEALRRFLLERDHGLGLRPEAMLHYAARIDHVESTIAPALASGRIVLSDRYSDSTLAYQGFGLGHGKAAILDFIRQLDGLVPVRPHRTLVFDLPVEQGRARLHRRSTQADRYEVLDEAFHQRVAAGFRHIAAAAPDRCVLIQAAGTIQEVQARVLHAVTPLLPRP